MKRLTKEITFKVWSYIEDGESLKFIADTSLGAEPRTIERLSAVLTGFKNGKPNDDLATPEWPNSKVIELREWWEDYLTYKHAWSRKIHLDSLMQDAQKLRSRTINPNVNMRIFTDITNEQSTWFYGGFDWRLTPLYWFDLVVPVIELADAWIPNFANLKSHLSNGSFLRHYAELSLEVEQLHGKISEFSDGLRENNPTWYDKWNNYEEYIEYFFVDGKEYKPDVIPSPDIGQRLIDNFSYLGNFLSETAIRLKQYLPDLDKKCDRIEDLLQKVYDDLDKDCIAQDIENGRCPRCSYKK
jgi:hypothetical protein